jgi:hypothetical protein
LEALAGWHTQQKDLLDWDLTGSDPTAARCVAFGCAATASTTAQWLALWGGLPESDIQRGAGPWFGESPSVFQLGFGYLPLPDFDAALNGLADTPNDVRG